MAASTIANAIHGASTIRSVPVNRVTPKLPVLSRSVHPVVVRAR
jgi:hypothetical protein